ncbi:AAA family ATPase [Nocardia sp. NPDC003345]
MAASVVGRDAELAWIRSLCTAAISGRSSVVVLTGDAGIGKTTLVAEAITQSDAFRTVAVAGVEAEFDLPFAALQRLVLAHRPALDDLSEAHRNSLLVAAGLAEGAVADRLAIGVAVLALVTALAARGPVFFWVDDSHWVDEQSLAVFAFAGRRLLADPVVMVFGRRSDTAVSVHLAGLPLRELPGLSVTNSVLLLRSVLHARIEPTVAEQIAVATGGNPLALRDLCGELTDRQLAGVSPLPDPGPIGTRLEAHYLRRIRLLPPSCRQWLLLAAAETDGNAGTIAAAAAAAELPREASAAAEVAELVIVADHVTFRHPLIRSAVYTASTSEQRRAAHRHLSQASAQLNLNQRALLHRAAATDGIDEVLAAGLEEVAALSGRRGDFATRTRLLVRAADTGTPPDRGRRLLAAAESAVFAGALQQALALMAEVDEDSLLAEERASLAVLRNEAQLPTAGDNTFGPRADALIRFAVALDDAGKHDEAVDAVGRAIRATWLSTHLTAGATDTDIAKTALNIVSADTPDAGELSLRAYAEFVLHHGTAIDTYRTATRHLIDHPSSALRCIHTYSGAVHIATLLIDDVTRDAVLGGLVDCTRRDSSKYLLANILVYRCLFDIQVGRVVTAREQFAETVVLLTACGYRENHPTITALRAGIRGWTGTPGIGHDESTDSEEICRRAAFGFGVDLWQRARLHEHLAAANPGPAWEAAERILSGTEHPEACLTADLIEAAVRAGRTETADRLQHLLDRRARILGTPLGTGLSALARAIRSADPEIHYRRAIEQLAAADTPMFSGRAHLQFGEWLRRQRRRAEATTHLRQAAHLFNTQKATGWHARAARELLPLGVEATSVGDRATRLTAQEELIANLAGRGATNQEIAEQLFLSPNTVDYHLRKVFRKLEVTSRRQLAAVLDRH